MSWQILCVSPFAWISFTQGQRQAKQNLSTKSHTRAATHPLVTNHMLCVERGILLSSGTCHIFQNGPAEFACPHHCGCNLGPYIKHFKAVSCKPCCFTSCKRRHAQRCRRCGGWFTPTMRTACCTWVGSRSYHKPTAPEFAGRLSETTSSGGLSAAVFGVHPSPSAAFAQTQTNPLGSRVQLGRPE